MPYKRFFPSITALAAGFILALGLMTGCTQSAAVKAIAVNQSQKSDKKPMITPTLNDDGKDTLLPPFDWSKIPTVTYCNLITNASDYDKKVVRVRAIYFSAFEKIYLYDDRCETGQPPGAPEKVPAETWAERDKSFVSQGDSDEARLNRRLNGFGRRDATLVGRFYSTNTNGDANAPNIFGHMGCCRFQFLIMRLEKLVLPRGSFDSRVKFERNQPIEIGDLTIEFVGGKNAVVSPIQFDTVSYFFNIKKGAIEKQVSWTNDADEKPLAFEIGGENYLMELQYSKEFGKLPPDEFVIRQTKP